MNQSPCIVGRCPYLGPRLSFFGAPNSAPGNHNTRHATSGYSPPSYNRKSVAMSGDNFENRKRAADSGKPAVQRILHTFHRQKFPCPYTVRESCPWVHVLTDAFPCKPGCRNGLQISPSDFSLRQRGFRNRSRTQLLCESFPNSGRPGNNIFALDCSSAAENLSRNEDTVSEKPYVWIYWHRRLNRSNYPGLSLVQKAFDKMNSSSCH